MPKYKTFVSPDGAHEQVVATPAREVQLRFEGWTEKPTAPAKTAETKPDPKPDQPKTTEKK